MILFQSLIPFTGLVCMLTRGWAGEDGCSVNGNRFPSYTYYHQTYNLETIFGVSYLGVHIQNTYCSWSLGIMTWPLSFPYILQPNTKPKGHFLKFAFLLNMCPWTIIIITTTVKARPAGKKLGCLKTNSFLPFLITLPHQDEINKPH